MDNHTDAAELIIKVIIMKLRSLQRLFSYTAAAIMKVTAKCESLVPSKHGFTYLVCCLLTRIITASRKGYYFLLA